MFGNILINATAGEPLIRAQSRVYSSPPFPAPLHSCKFDCVNLGSLYNQFELNMMKRLIEEV